MDRKKYLFYILPFLVFIFTGKAFASDLLIHKYNDLFRQKNYFRAFQVIQDLENSQPDNIDFLKEHAKIAGAIGSKKEFFNAMAKIRLCCSTSSLKWFFEVLRSPLIPISFKISLQKKLLKERDLFILERWNLELNSLELLPLKIKKEQLFNLHLEPISFNNKYGYYAIDSGEMWHTTKHCDGLKASNRIGRMKIKKLIGLGFQDCEICKFDLTPAKD